MNVYSSRITLKHLMMMHAIASTDSLTRAADLLNISQPALSNRLRNAEEAVGMPLFLKRGRSFAPTAAGTLLLECAGQVLRTVASVEAELARLPESPGRSIRVGMPTYASHAWIPAAVTAFEAYAPGHTLDILTQEGTDPLEMLQRDDVDFVLVATPQQTLKIDRKRFVARRLFRDEFVALFPTAHPLAAKAYLTAADFVDQTYITNSTVPERNREYELFFQAGGGYPGRVIQVGFTGAIPELVAARVGCTILTRWINQQREAHDGVTACVLTRAGLHLNWFAVFPKENPSQGVFDTLCELIGDSYQA